MDSYQTDISRQTVHFLGRRYTAEDILSGRFRSIHDSSALFPSLADFLEEWFSSSPDVRVQTSGSTGVPQKLEVEKKRMMHSAMATCRFFHLDEGQKAYLCMNLKYIGAKMMVVRSLVAGMEIVLAPEVSGRPFQHLEEDLDFAAIVPLQLFNTLEKEPDRLDRIRTLIVGGGSVDESLLQRIQGLGTAVYSTYGMTETLSHIALRKLNGPDKSIGYRPLEGISLSRSKDGRLRIEAPLLTDHALLTNDLVQMEEDGSFLIVGRADNVIVSGGVKLQMEEIEKKLSEILSRKFAITALPHEKFGEIVLLLVECPVGFPMEKTELEELKRRMQETLEKYERPKGILSVLEIPMTETGKIQRSACRELAMRDKNRIFV